jgi:hypothetical protein
MRIDSHLFAYINFKKTTRSPKADNNKLILKYKGPKKHLITKDKDYYLGRIFVDHA